MSRAKVWYGYLEAGKKSTPVVRDDSLETGNPKMIYLFNFSKNAFLEYAAAVVEPKLRELSTSENEVAEDLKKAYAKAREAFQGRSERAAGTVEISPRTSASNNSTFMDQSSDDDESAPFLDDSDDWEDD